VQAGNQWTGKQFCNKGPLGPGGHQDEHKPSMCSCCKSTQQHPGLLEERCQQVERVDLSSALNPGATHLEL